MWPCFLGGRKSEVFFAMFLTKLHVNDASATVVKWLKIGLVKFGHDGLGDGYHVAGFIQFIT